MFWLLKLLHDIVGELITRKEEGTLSVLDKEDVKFFTPNVDDTHNNV